MSGHNEINSAHKPRQSVLFYALKAIQFLTSVIVGAIWSFLFYQLMKDHQDVLGTFFFLAAISFLSIIIVTTTTFVVWLSGPQSAFGMCIVSLVLAAIWIGNVTVLSHHVSGTLGSPCDLVHFNGTTAIAVCKLYKALFGITIVALVSFGTGLALDLYTLWQTSFQSASRLAKEKEQKLSVDV